MCGAELGNDVSVLASNEGGPQPLRPSSTTRAFSGLHERDRPISAGKRHPTL